MEKAFVDKFLFFLFVLSMCFIAMLFIGCPTVSNNGGSTTYMITFDSQNATVKANPTSKTVTSPATTVGTLPTPPTRTGYAFSGWWTAVNGGGTAFTASTVVIASITVYAKWTANITYMVTFNKNDAGATGTMSPQTIVSGSSASLTACGFTKTGWLFAGWAATTGGSVVYVNQASYTMGASDVTLYAKWTEPFAGILYRDMAAVPAITGFSMGYANVATPVHTVTSISAFTIGKYEVTYELWNAVYIWAKSNGYVFSNDTGGTTGICGSSGSGGAIQPVTTISWRDCIVWCNAYSTMSGLQPVYCTDAGFTLPLKTCDGNATSATTIIAGNEDNPYVNWSATGYRLPTEAEWEECARYIDGTTWLSGDHVSGDTTGYCHNSGNPGTLSSVFGNYAWYSVNSGSITKDVGTRIGNAFGLYDMTGNVWEWCWDWYGIYTTLSPYIDADTRGQAYNSTIPCRIGRGGSWYNSTSYCQVGYRGYNFSNITDDSIGFRVVRKAP